MKQPKEFKKSPLVDATIEIRFQAQPNAELLAGQIYSYLKDEFVTINELPSLQIPLAVRERDPNLQFQPTHKLESAEYYLNIGPNVVGLGCKINGSQEKYPGWDKFSKKFIDLITKLKKLGALGPVNRVGLRYINFFQRQDLFSDLNVTIETGWEGKGLQPDKMISIAIADNNYITRLSINTNITAQNATTIKQGQLVDIDTSYEVSGGKDLSTDLKAIVGQSHKRTEDVFFNLLSDNLKKELGAKYE